LDFSKLLATIAMLKVVSRENSTKKSKKNRMLGYRKVLENFIPMD
jgi:hypothetical protein